MNPPAAMRKRKHQVAAEYSLTSGGEMEYFNPISVDLIINILSRLSAKSMAKCRCVSKLWSSILRRPNYNQLFPIKAPAAPRLLFAFVVGGKLVFFSLPQPYENSSGVVATLHSTNLRRDVSQICRPVGGLLCYQKNHTVAVISNPITGESLTSPNLNGKVRYSFGYDPIGKQSKVLCFTRLPSGSHKYHVLTLENGNGNGNLLSWRKIQSCCRIHYPLDDNGICINGVLYYPAWINNGKRFIARFDVRSEKFSLINVDKGLAIRISQTCSFTLIDYKGRLGACYCETEHSRFELWVLEDAEEHKWSKHIYQMPRQWRLSSNVCAAGMIASGEIVLYPSYVRRPFYIFYYNLETNSITRVKVEVPGFEESRVNMFTNFVENVKLI